MQAPSGRVEKTDPRSPGPPLRLSIPRGFFLLSFYIVISWNMSLFKAWSEDKLNKKFVVAENLQNLFPKVSDSFFPGGWGI